MPLSVDQLIAGRYRLARKLGEGAMGVVFEAENVLIHRRVAIKVLHAHVAERLDARSRFEREAQAAGRIGSSHIVEVLDLGELSDGSRFMVMELLEGVTLSQRIRAQGRLGPEEAAGLVCQLLSGLGAAHAADIVHRDLKPANVFLSGNRGAGDFVKILDFGVSKFSVAGDDMGMTGAGSVLGTPHYMSPEQAKGARHIDARSDLYAVGVILYECVTGHVPFEAQTFNELIFRIVLESPPPVEAQVPGLDPAFAAIVRKAMARELDERYQSAGEMAAALTRWLSPDRPAVELANDATELWAGRPLARRPGKKRSGERALVLGLLGALALGAFTLFAVRPRAADAPEALPSSRPVTSASAPSPVDPVPASVAAVSAATAAPVPAPSLLPTARLGKPFTPRHKPSASAPVVPTGKRTVPSEL